MNERDIPTLQYHVERIVKDADRPGGPLAKGEFTMKKARHAIATALGLETTCLDDSKWKAMVKDLIQDALDNLPSASSPAKPKRAPKPKTKPNAKSRATPPPSPTPSPQVRKTASEQAEVISISSSPEPEPRSAAIRTTSAPARKVWKPIKDDVINLLSEESEMSSVYDEPPKRNKGKSVVGTKKRHNSDAKEGSEASERETKVSRAEPKKKRRTSKAADLPPDEARVAELKKLVFACGVRKQWFRELADCSTTKSQISHLLRLLQDLGIKGTPTLGKAKALKAKRELEAEIEDVVAFEAERGVGAAGPKRNDARKASKVVLSDAEDSDDGPKVQSANQAVFDFIAQNGDESD